MADLKNAIREYSRSRHTPVVRVTLASGESHYVMRATALDADLVVAFDVYPEPPDQLLEVERVDDRGELEKNLETRIVLIVHPATIAKVELLDDRPGERGDFGFRAPHDE